MPVRFRRSPLRHPRLLAHTVLAVLGLALPASATAANPGQVEVVSQTLNYSARAGEANRVSVSFSADAIVVRDEAARLDAGLGCHPGSSVHEVRCTRDDASTGGGSYGGSLWSRYEISTGDLDDVVQVSVEEEVASGPWSSSFSAVSGTIDGGPGADRLQAADGTDSLIGGPGADVLRGGGGDWDIAVYAERTAPVTVTLGGDADDGEPGEGDDVGTDIEGALGGSGDDTLIGDGRTNQLSGGNGVDTLRGGGGNDVLQGGGGWWYGPPYGNEPAGTDGGDTLDGGAGNDHLAGGIGGDVFEGGDGTDTADFSDHGGWYGGDAPESEPLTITVGVGTRDDGNSTDGPEGGRDDVRSSIENVQGSAGADTITGSDVSNRIDGGGGRDTISGSGGADVLLGGADRERDELFGGAGNDLFVASQIYNYGPVAPGTPPGDGPDAYDGGTDLDKVDYGARQSPIHVTLDDAIANEGERSGDTSEADRLTAVEDVTGGAQGDQITGDDEPNRLHGGPGGGADTIDGRGGDDRISGGAGDYATHVNTPPYYGGDGVDTLTAGDGNDVVHARDFKADTISCGADGDEVTSDDGQALHPWDDNSVRRPVDAIASAADCEAVNAPVEDTAEGTTPVSTGTTATAADPVEVTVTDTNTDDSAPSLKIVERSTGYWGDVAGWTVVGQVVEVRHRSSIDRVNASERELTIEITADASLGEGLRLLGTDAQNPLVPACNGLPPEDRWTPCLVSTAITDGDAKFTVRAPGAWSSEYATSHWFRLGVPSAGRVALSASTGTSARLVYTAASGEANDVTVRFSSDRIVLTDAGATALRAGSGCVLTQSQEVRCTREESSYTWSEYRIDAGDGDDDVTVVTEAQPSQGSGPFAPSTHVNINGTVLGGPGADALRGGAGQDALVGGPGPDVLRGGEGTYDSVSFSEHEEGVVVTTNDGAANDGGPADGPVGARDDVGADVETVTGSAHADVLTGGDGTQHLYGGGGADTLRGGDGNDWLHGDQSFYASGTTYVNHEPGEDALEGGAGRDLMTGGAEPDRFDGGDGQDFVDYSDHGQGGWSDSGPVPGEGVTVTLGSGTDDDGNSTDERDGRRDRIASTVEHVIGSRADDVLTGSAGPNRLDGGDGADRLVGGDGNDSFSGGYDDDPDVIDGGAGADVLRSNNHYGFSGVTHDGAEAFSGGPGNDAVDYSMRSSAVTVTLDGVADDGQSGEGDRIGADVESVTGGSGSDRLVGDDGGPVDAGADRLHGGPGGADEIDGRAGNDVLLGGGTGWGSPGMPSPAGDTLRGGAGEDILNARNGIVDTVDCGEHIDIAFLDPDTDAYGSDVEDAATGCELRNPKGGTRKVEPGGTVVLGAADTTPSNPIALETTSPSGGTVTFAQSEVVARAPQGVDFLGLQLQISAPPETRETPLRILFRVDSSLVPAGGLNAIRVFRDGGELDADCSSVPAGQATEDGCIAQRSLTADGDAELVVLSAHASTWNFATTAAKAPAADDPSTGGPTPGTGGSTPGSGGSTPGTGDSAAEAGDRPAGGEPRPSEAGTGLAGGGGAPRDTTPPAATVSAMAVQRLSALLKRGLKVSLSCSEACAVRAELRVGKAKQLRLPALLAKRTSTLPAGGSTKVTLRLTRAAKAKLGRQRRIAATLVVTAVDAAGNVTVVRRSVSIRR